ncbi:MAG: hypothetical protein EXQ91_02200 [Alphaproteobacteria bacterium]|nr:hypothetical protein [Alphaproteobacteria bacterium]
MNVFTNIVLAPYLDTWVLAAIAAVSAALLAYGVYQRAPGTGWRAFAIAVVLVGLADPTFVREERDQLSDVVAIVIDESPSQAIGERRQQSEQALAAITAKLAKLRDLDVRVVRAGKFDPTTATGRDGPGTRLFGALADAVSDIPRDRIAGTIVITDGQVHDIPSEGSWLFGGPLHVLLSGNAGEQDRRLVVEQVPTYGIVGRKLELRVRVEDDSVPAGSQATARVLLRKDGGDTIPYAVRIGTSRVIPFELDHGGQTILEIEVDAGTKELTVENNRAIASINGVRDRLRVLLVSGEPHPGERTWRNLLKADPSVDLVHFTILRPPEKQDGTPVRELSLIAFPVRELFELKLKEFDLVIFDRYHRRGIIPLAYYSNIVDYVRGGGALLEAAGPQFASQLSLFRTPVAQILPSEPTGTVFEQGFKPLLTPVGRRHPVSTSLPGGEADVPEWGRWFRMLEVSSERGNTILNGIQGKPLLILDRVGKGRVAQLLSDHAWLWTRGYEGGGPQAELLRRLAHWLMKEPDLEEERLKATTTGGRIEIERRSLTPDRREVTITKPSGATETVTLPDAKDGVAQAAVSADELGLYRLDDGSKTAVVAVGSVNAIELSDVRSTERYLAPLAKATGGAINRIASRALPDVRRVRPGQDAAGRGWIGLVRSGSYVVTGVSQLPLMPPYLALALILGPLALGWRREGR